MPNSFVDQIYGESPGYLVRSIDNSFYRYVLESVVSQLKDLSIINNVDIGSKYLKDGSAFFANLDPSLFCKLANLSRQDRTISRKKIEIDTTMILDMLSDYIPRPDLIINNDLYFRVVESRTRPSISSVHRDIYFHTILPEWKPIDKIKDIKMWIPLYSENSASLGVLKGSNLDQTFDDCTFEYDLNKHLRGFNCSIKSDDLYPVNVKPGEALFFGPHLVHGSLPISKIGERRVSAEFTLGYLAD